MESRKTVKPFAPEVRERAVRMVREHCEAHGSQWAAIHGVAAKIGCGGETARATGSGRPSATPALGPGRRARSASASARSSARSARCGRVSPDLIRGRRGPEEGFGVFCDGGARPPSEAMIAFVDAHRATYGVEPRPRSGRGTSLPAAGDRPAGASRPCRRPTRSGPGVRPRPAGRRAAPRDRARARGELRALTASGRACPGPRSGVWRQLRREGTGVARLAPWSG